jgi:hypothetical protein
MFGAAVHGQKDLFRADPLVPSVEGNRGHPDSAGARKKQKKRAGKYDGGLSRGER